ncbi:MAG: hypothetical protein ABUL73_03975 [Alphaproteobacteria bacterium]
MTTPIPIRIVCTHDAAKLAEDLRRLLSAEQHAVEICCGRQSLVFLEASRELREAVLLIWSVDAPSSHYMLQWATHIEPTRVVEISRTRMSSGFAEQRGKVIDFSKWEGQRGGHAWRDLESRLADIARATEPPKPPPRYAAMALVAVSAIAVGEAALVRMHDVHHDAMASTTEDTVQAPAAQPPAPVVHVADAHSDSEGEGGPLTVSEPASKPVEEVVHLVRGARRVPMLNAALADDLKAAHIAPSLHYSESNPWLLDRLSALAAPLMGGEDHRRD